MYIGKLIHSSRIEKLNPAFRYLFEFIKKQNFNNLPLGKIELDGDNLFIMNLDIPQGTDIANQPLEMHRQYIDVHILLEGTERIGWKPIEDISVYVQNYNTETDCALSNDKPQFFVDLIPGDICIVYPEDPHAPAISNGRIRKLIGKVRI